MTKLPEWVAQLKEGSQLKRAPAGRTCRVLAVPSESSGELSARVLVRDGRINVWIKRTTLAREWLPAGPSPLRALLTRMKDVHPNDLAPSLRDLRKNWLEAGCPGLAES